MFITRCKYYIPWKLSSACMIFCGLSYYYETPNPSELKEGEIVSPHKFDKCMNIHIRNIEMETNPRNSMRVI